MFLNLTKEIDDILDRGKLSDLNYYVEHTFTRDDNIINFSGNSFEEYFAETLFPSRGEEAGCKGVFLRGNVGKGKTTFSRYIKKHTLPKRYPDIIVVYINALRAEPRILEGLVREQAIREVVEKGLYSSRIQLLAEVFKMQGHKDLTSFQVEELASKQMRIENIIEMLDKKRLAKHFVLILDNIDENPKEVITEAVSLTGRLHEFCSNLTCLSSALVMPVRTYTYDYDQTIPYVPIDLPPIDNAKMINKKYEKLKDILKLTDDRSMKAFVTDYEARGCSREKVITVSKNNALGYLSRIIETLVNKDTGLYSALTDLAAGNLKHLNINIHNLLQSRKLEHDTLFLRSFMPDISQAEALRNFRIPFHLLCECLMAVHYPYFDVQDSLVINVFNCSSSKIANDFHNTLMIVRLISFLNNRGQESYRVLKSVLTMYGYPPEYISQGLDKCLRCGVVHSDHGTKCAEFNEDTQLYSCSATQFYIERLINEPTYLQYASEDTPMEDNYIIDIEKKYRKGDHTGDKKQRIRSIELMVDFVCKEEALELQDIKENRKLDYTWFLKNVGIRSKGDYLPLSIHLKKKLQEFYDKVMNQPGPSSK